MGQAAIESDGINVFVVYNGVRIAKRSHSGTPLAGTWVSLEAGLHRAGQGLSARTCRRVRGQSRQ
jgi:hypothetical protein